MDAAVAPPPRIVATTGGSVIRSCSAATAPGTSVFSPTQPEVSWTSVLAAPARSAMPVTSLAYSSASRFSGAVTDRPRHSSPSGSTVAASPPAGTSTASYCQSRPTAA